MPVAIVYWRGSNCAGNQRQVSRCRLAHGRQQMLRRASAFTQKR